MLASFVSIKQHKLKVLEELGGKNYLQLKGVEHHAELLPFLSPLFQSIAAMLGSWHCISGDII